MMGRTKRPIIISVQKIALPQAHYRPSATFSSCTDVF